MAAFHIILQDGMPEALLCRNEAAAGKGRPCPPGSPAGGHSSPETMASIELAISPGTPTFAVKARYPESQK